MCTCVRWPNRLGRAVPLAVVLHLVAGGEVGIRAIPVGYRFAESTLFSQVDMLGAWYKSVNFGAGQSPVSPNWCAQIDWNGSPSRFAQIDRDKIRFPKQQRGLTMGWSEELM